MGPAVPPAPQAPGEPQGPLRGGVHHRGDSRAPTRDTSAGRHRDTGAVGPARGKQAEDKRHLE